MINTKDDMRDIMDDPELGIELKLNPKEVSDVSEEYHDSYVAQELQRQEEYQMHSDQKVYKP